MNNDSEGGYMSVPSVLSNKASLKKKKKQHTTSWHMMIQYLKIIKQQTKNKIKPKYLDLFFS